MAASAGGRPPASGQRTGEGRLSWPVFLLTLAAVTSSSLSALSLHRLVALRAEVEGLKSELGRGGRARRPDGECQWEGLPGVAAPTCRSTRRPPGEEEEGGARLRSIRTSQSCLQLLANGSRKTFRKNAEYNSEAHTGIPWQAGLRRGSALEADGDSMLVREEGFYFVYSQVYYMDSTFAMGHVVIRRKRNVVGDEPQYVILFRCIQNMNPVHPYNTCYTGGVVKLEAGDHVELLIPRPTANVSLDGDTTFLGAVKLA
ncbi:tumor necrosis factor ligand superfamily member 13B isoform 1-T1 [Spinachia spinachia]